MKIAKNSVVELIYTLTVDGQVADQTTKERPRDFIFGIGILFLSLLLQWYILLFVPCTQPELLFLFILL